ncbi:MAG: peptide MFS transporter [Chitinophagaceae bacterium]|nr:peptide MFS transporter [Chitinophagaceae bacterium]MBK7678478.1 peptide MFS transporter [Chitinophagaceae bacterium]MBK8300170.1 peptide MFS transporter [Chitinophagaceae bacterium]MBK9464213.1 peptide MFS transporter [Chitinophagaceae bacterium]MBK9658664.1 peptide MFS transporter [Chitinophagaceae bacterium]
MTQPANLGKHPKGLYVLFFTEMWERFGYYLMVGILLLFLTDGSGKGLPRAMGTDVVGTFIALVYLTPFIGGLLADRYLGYMKSIFIGGSLMAAGYLTIALPGEYTAYISMGLIIIGNGFFKPNISTLLGNMYNREDLRPLKDNAYNIFYMGINIGAFFCNFIAAILRNQIGWQAAFSAAGIGLIIGMIALAFSLKHVKEYDVKRPMQPGDMPTSKILGSVFAPMIVFAALGWIIPGNIFGSDSSDAFILACVPVIFFYVTLWRKEKGEDKKGIGALLFIFAVSIIFWTIYNQNSTGLTIWAESHTDRSIPQFMEGPADAVYTLQNLETKPQQVDSMDSYMRVVTDDSGHAIKTMGPDPYFANMPQDQWPANGVAKVGNTELFQSINPFFIVAFTPLLILFFAWRVKRGKPISTASKFAWALVIAGLSALVMVFAVMSVPSIYTHKTSSMWLFLTYGIFTVSEICLSPIGLSFVSKLAPQRLTALMMGGWFISTSLGGKVAGVMASSWDSMHDKRIFFGVIAVAAILGGLLIFSRVKSLDKIVKDKTGSAV